MENLTFHRLFGWKMITLPILTTSPIHFSLKGWENVLFELGSERGKLIPQCCLSLWRFVFISETNGGFQRSLSCVKTVSGKPGRQRPRIDDCGQRGAEGLQRHHRCTRERLRRHWGEVSCGVRTRYARSLPNPFCINAIAPKSDEFKISPAASPEI